MATAADHPDPVIAAYDQFCLQREKYEGTIDDIIRGGATTLADQMRWASTTDLLAQLHAKLLHVMTAHGSLLIGPHWYSDAVELDLPVYLIDCLQACKTLSANVGETLNATLSATAQATPYYTIHQFVKVGRDIKRIVRHLRILLRQFITAIGGADRIEQVVFYAIAIQLCDAAQFHAPEWTVKLLNEVDAVRASFVFAGVDDDALLTEVENSFYVVTGMLQALQSGAEATLSSIYSVDVLSQNYTANACKAFQSKCSELFQDKNYQRVSVTMDRETRLFTLIVPNANEQALKKQLRSALLTENSVLVADLTSFLGQYPNSQLQDLRAILNVFENTTLDQHFLEKLLPGAVHEALSKANTIDDCVMLFEKSHSFVKEVITAGRTLDTHKVIDHCFRSAMAARTRFDEDLVESIHLLLKKQSRAQRPSNTVAKKVESTVRFAQHVVSSDIFFLHYRRRLSSRLFSDVSPQVESEMQIVQLLSAVMGPSPQIAVLSTMIVEFQTRVLDRSVWLDNETAAAPRVPIPECLVSAVNTATESICPKSSTTRTELDPWRTNLLVELTRPNEQTLRVAGPLPLVSILVFAHQNTSDLNETLSLHSFAESLGIPDRFALLCLRSMVRVGVFVEQPGEGDNGKHNPMLRFANTFSSTTYTLPRFKLQW